MEKESKFLHYYVSYISKPEANAKIDAYKMKIAIGEKKCDLRYEALLKEVEGIALNHGMTFDELMREIEHSTLNPSEIARLAKSKIDEAVGEIQVERMMSEEYIKKINDIKCSPSTYTPEEMFVREKGSDSKAWGSNIIFRRMRKVAVEVHSGAAVYPLRHIKAEEAKAQYLARALPVRGFEGLAPDMGTVAAAPVWASSSTLEPPPAQAASGADQNPMSRRKQAAYVAADVALDALEVAARVVLGGG
jgi:hypothetical protein